MITLPDWYMRLGKAKAQRQLADILYEGNLDRMLAIELVREVQEEYRQI